MADGGATEASLLELLGAGAFGAVIGWLLYFLNRHRGDEVRLADLVTVIGAIGGSAVLALFPAGSELFGAYGIGLFAGFFGYLATLAILVSGSEDFEREWFIDGRHKPPAEEQVVDLRGPLGPQDEPQVVN